MSFDDLMKKLNAMVPGAYVTDNESRDVVLKYPAGTLAYTIKMLKFSNGNRSSSLTLRFTRARDQKVYVERYGNARFEQFWGEKATSETIRNCFEKPQHVVPADRNCVIIVNHCSPKFYMNNVEVILNELVDSGSEEAKTIDRLVRENAELKRVHAAEIATLRAEAAARDDARPTKKSKTATEVVDLANTGDVADSVNNADVGSPPDSQ